MPNWCFNEVTVKGFKSDIDAFVKRYGLEEKFDFNKVIPEPKFIEECPENCILKGDEHVEIFKDRPWFNWYDWRVKHWGTKWNACDSLITRVSDTELYIQFSTAWDRPKQVFEKLKRNNRHLIIKFDWEV